MKGLMTASGLALAVFATSAKAADLYDTPPPPRYGGSAYEDPRYADVYRYPDRPVPPARVYPDEEYSYPPRERSAYREDYRGDCVPRHFIRERLQREGWQDFADPDIRGDIATLRARRPNGQPFVITIERCTGNVVNVRPVSAPGPYAYAPPPPPRRWDRPYY